MGADATTAQAWYREQAEQFGDWTAYYLRLLLGGQNALTEALRNARFAGHFGNLALATVPPQGHDDCINCRRRLLGADLHCYFGRPDRLRVGPLCETCESIVKVHTGLSIGVAKAASPRVAPGPQEPT